jgi:hypothetical protein
MCHASVAWFKSSLHQSKSMSLSPSDSPGTASCRWNRPIVSMSILLIDLGLPRPLLLACPCPRPSLLWDSSTFLINLSLRHTHTHTPGPAAAGRVLSLNRERERGGSSSASLCNRYCSNKDTHAHLPGQTHPDGCSIIE